LNEIRRQWDEKPLPWIMALATAVRLPAMLFSRGYGMYDDHFLVVEVAQAWLDGIPMWLDTEVPEKKSLVYPGFFYLLFGLLERMGMYDPEVKTLVGRVLHGLFSLLTVYYTYKIARRLGSTKAARLAGMCVAAFWFMPFMSVRFLVETAALPFVLAGTHYALKAQADDRPGYWLAAGFLMGLSFAVRYQTILILGGTGLALLILRRRRGALFFGLGGAAGLFALQGAVDAYFWKIPFSPLYYYYEYNVKHAADYPVLPWYNYLLLFAGVFVPPLSLFLLFGAVRDWRKNLLVFLPTFVFFAFHSYHINKQERFVLTIVPQVIALGAVGWEKFRDGSAFWAARPQLHSRLMTAVWTMNFVVLIPLSFSSSKLHAVDTMRFLGSRPEGEHRAVIFDCYRKNKIFAPEFYLGKGKRMPVQIEFKADETPEHLRRRLGPLADSIHYVLIFQDVDVPLREERLRTLYPNLRRDTVIQPALLDKIMYALNPINLNQTVYVYRTGIE
jgi:hypothetical protein